MSRSRLVHARFAEWVKHTPDTVAVEEHGRTLTYTELDSVSDAVAHELLRRGLEPEEPVAVQIPRGAAAVVAFLATLKAGGCYVPVDPAYPAPRQRSMIEDSGCTVVLENSDIDLEMITAVPVPPAPIDQARLAYTVYTSGSTGTPKGVMVEHRNICALLDEPILGIRSGERVAQTVSMSFDVATFEIWGALCNGATLVIMPSGRDITTLADATATANLDWMFLTTGVFHLMVEHRPDALTQVRRLLAGGDVLGPEQFDRATELVQEVLINAYGPSETTTFSGLYATDKPVNHPSVPIGTAPRGETLIIDTQGGEPIGEILIGGAGVSRGYRNQPRLTAERFVPDPTSTLPGGRAYRSGDLGSQSGNLWYIHGRIDRQVKVRGHRIELPEIESTLASHPEVTAAAVRVCDDAAGDKRLAGYVSLTPNSAISGTSLLDWLSNRLPDFMIPSGLKILNTLPLDPNGKVDRSSLPPLWSSRDELPGLGQYTAPRTQTETWLAELWGSVLDIDRVGMDDNFFLLGGDSLHSMAVMAALAEAGSPVTAEEFFTNQTVRKLASLMTWE